MPDPIYLVINSVGIPIYRGSHDACMQYQTAYGLKRRREKLPPDPCVVRREQLRIAASGLRRLATGLPIVTGMDSLRAVDAAPTGLLFRGWHGGLDGSPTDYEEWTATIQDTAAGGLDGARVRCYRPGTSKLDRGRCLPSEQLMPVELLRVPETCAP